MKRVNAGDALAIHTLGCLYSKGIYGFKQNYTKALEYWEQALELGDAKAYHDEVWQFQWRRKKGFSERRVLHGISSNKREYRSEVQFRFDRAQRRRHEKSHQTPLPTEKSY